MAVIVGGVVEKEGKYLLVRESNPKCYGKWNLPAGHLDVGETLFDGAIREIKEETNCDVELTGISEIGNQIQENDVFVGFVFKTRLLTDEAKLQAGEILEIKWFTYDEIVSLGDQLRSPEWIINAVANSRANHVISLDFIDINHGKQVV